MEVIRHLGQIDLLQECLALSQIHAFPILFAQSFVCFVEDCVCKLFTAKFHHAWVLNEVVTTPAACGGVPPTWLGKLTPLNCFLSAKVPFVVFWRQVVPDLQHCWG